MEFHSVTKVWETTHTSFTMVKLFSSLPSPFHTKLVCLLMCHAIIYAWHSTEMPIETGLNKVV
jgi:hypothetical protein